jgi:alanyl-tRNA synthetase
MQGIPLGEDRSIAYDDAIAAGATALFGEKYGDTVRMITFDPGYSRELCGGTHVKNTAAIGFCKITQETSVAAGVRRLEAVTNHKALDWLKKQTERMHTMKALLGNPPDAVKALEMTVKENDALKKQVESFQMQQASALTKELKALAVETGGMQLISKQLKVGSTEIVKKIAFDLKREIPSLFLVLGAEIDGKAHLSVMIDEALAKSKDLDASKIVREAAQHIQGGGGGQAFYATAGGKKVEGISAAIESIKAKIAG